MLLVFAKCLSMLGVCVGTHGLAPCGAAQTGIEMAFCLFQGKERQRRRRRVPSLHPFHCFEGRDVVAGEKTRLELSDPVVAFQKGARRLTRDALLEGALCECTIIEASELRGCSAQGPGERDWRGKSVQEESVPLQEIQCVLGFALELVEWMAQCDENGTETARSECGICRLAVIFRHLEGTTRGIDALP